MDQDAMTQEAFFTLHRDLPREGPGEAEDVAWATALAGLRDDAEIADIACGPGADIAALLLAAPNGHVTALDKTPHFVASARAAWRDDPRVMVLQADMARIMNAYDLIWCAGAVYFLGITEALSAWRKSLKPGGVVAFSEPCWFTPTPSDAASKAWADYPAMTDAAGIHARVTAAGYTVLGRRQLSNAAWEAYYTPLEHRLISLQQGAAPVLAQTLAQHADEIATWRAHHAEFGYQLTLVRPT